MSDRLLVRVLDEPNLVAAVQGLAPQALGRLVDKLGLEDAGELIALASTEQVAQMLDDDLWASGELDADRFVVWLEVMLEAGEAFVAQRLAELDEDLLTLALHKLVLVFDVDDLMRLVDRRAEKVMGNCLFEELGHYQLISRKPDGWDAVLHALLALDRDSSELVERLLDRCARMSSGVVETEGGLYEALTAEQTLEVDAAANRDERRAELGFVSPDDARAFLAGKGTRRDHVTAQYLKIAAGRPLPKVPAAESQRLLRLLGSEQPITQRLLEATGGEAPRFVTALRALRDRPGLFAERMNEVSYLSNVLMAAGTRGGRKLRPIEAVEEVIAACSRGLERGGASLVDHGADHFFKLGWPPRDATAASRR
jgi:hypothetical protein